MDGTRYDQTRNDAMTARWICNLGPKDRITATLQHTTCFPRRFNVEYTWCVCRVRNWEYLQNRRLLGLGYLKRMEESSWPRKYR